jgi:hypothetical protein
MDSSFPSSDAQYSRGSCNPSPAEVDALKHLQAETAVELDALLPAILDRAFGVL